MPNTPENWLSGITRISESESESTKCGSCHGRVSCPACDLTTRASGTSIHFHHDGVTWQIPVVTTCPLPVRTPVPTVPGYKYCATPGQRELACGPVSVAILGVLRRRGWHVDTTPDLGLAVFGISRAKPNSRHATSLRIEMHSFRTAPGQVKLLTGCHDECADFRRLIYFRDESNDQLTKNAANRSGHLLRFRTHGGISLPSSTVNKSLSC